ncbi:MAG: type I-C CRISPR-associated protein Cas8c/Csd1 [Zoogloeaceae bacterium]|nr:type I-C CRISPR-associated protein Cas8c/Csd1 [Rhodocyclaceae bacterium]MCP5234310.1 type I-C CRISPR-associated protein Cas8c/Csd1 [Zoogloeaceae bacterium]
MILQALARYYQRLIERDTEGISPYGYSPEKISYSILLSPQGEIVQVQDICDTTGKKPQPRMMGVPQPEKRTVGIKSNFLWDKTSYVLGVSASSKRADKEHQAFKALHEEALAETEDPGLKAFLSFIRKWDPNQFCAPHFSDDMLDANIVFRLDGEQAYLHERPAARAIRTRLLGTGAEVDDAEGATSVCLVRGECLPIARLHPAVKGVNGAQSSGASIVSFNLDAFSSYGKNQGENAPVSEQAAFAYTTVLNHLLRRSEHNRQRLQVGDATVVFWAEADDAGQAERAEFTFADLLDPPPEDGPEAARIRRLLDGIAQGRPLDDIDPGLAPTTHMYVLGLAPNASRLSIRFWQVDTLDVLTRRVVQHREDLRLQPLPWKSAPSVWRLALATAPSRDGRAKSEDIPPQLAGELMRAILTGSNYPGSLLANLVMRMRTDGDISGVRVALCKAVIARGLRIQLSEEEIPVSLDKQSTQPGYLLGRLFAVLEYVQRSALGGQVNATIRDRYYGAASATPASIFPVLLRNTQNHMSKLRKERPGQAVVLEKEIREVVAGLPERFPRSLKIEDQGRFAIGYYHQSQAHFSKRGADGDAAPEPEPEAQGAQL